MPEKDPSSYSLLTYAWVIGLAAVGGIVNFFKKVEAGETQKFNIIEFIGELVTSAFTGVITFWLCEEAGISGLVTAALVGISGHMGSRFLFLLEDYLKKKFSTLP